MKWMVAGAGALLSLGGAYALISGSSIIQVERGWAMVIAGAVVFSAGFILLGIAALIARIEQIASRFPAGAVAPRAAFPQPSFRERPGRAPEGFGAAPAAAAGAGAAVGLAAAQSEARDDVRPAREAPGEDLTSAPADRPAALRDFTFVFPVEPAAEAPNAPEPATAAAAEPEPEAPRTEAVAREETQAGEPSPAAGRFGLPWLRRNRETDSPLRAPEPENAPELVEATIEVTEERKLFALRIEEPPPARGQAPAPEAETAREEEPEAAEIEREADRAPEPGADTTPDPFSPDWLERALAGTDEPQPPARFTPPSMRRAAAAQAAQETPADAEAAPAAAVPEPQEPAPSLAEESDQKPSAAGPAPVEIGRYRSNDVAYIMFSDGSITAETPAGATYQFKSLLELRAFIERGGA